MTDSEKIDATLDISLVLLDATRNLMEVTQTLTTIVSCKDPKTLCTLMGTFGALTTNKKALDDVIKYAKGIGLYDL